MVEPGYIPGHCIFPYDRVNILKNDRVRYFGPETRWRGPAGQVGGHGAEYVPAVERGAYLPAHEVPVLYQADVRSASGGERKHAVVGADKKMPIAGNDDRAP